MNCGQVDRKAHSPASIGWTRANKLGLCDALLRQKPVRLLGDIYMLAVSNTNATLQSNKSVFHNKGVRFPCFCFLVNQDFDLLVVGDVSGHPGVMAKCNVTL